MKRLFVALAILILVSGTRGGASPTVIGDLNNFDTVNDTGQVTYGFEIEIDDIRSTDITYTYDWNHYGAPIIREDLSDPAHPKVFVRYASTKDSSGQFGANNSFTNPAIPSLTPPQGHSCTDPSVNEGCEHFGIGYYGTPTRIVYNWLVSDGAGSLVTLGSPVGISTPTWTYTPPLAGAPAQVVAAIPAPPVPIPAGRQFGEPSWVKVVKTTTHNARPVALRDLVSHDGDGDGEPDWQNGEPAEVESEWFLLQTRAGGNGARDELVGAPDELGDPSEQVTRRYEFYRYGAAPNTLDGENGEAMCSEVQPTTDPTDPLYLHGVGTDVEVTDANGDSYTVNCEAQVVVGPYAGAQMAGFAAGAALGFIDHLQDGAVGVAYGPRTVVIGGAQPYQATVTGLPDGLTLGSYTDPLTAAVAEGVLSGVPTVGGDFQVTVSVTDTDGTQGSTTFTLHVEGAAAGLSVASIDPLAGPAGTVVTITGTGFTPDASVLFNGAPSMAVTVVSDTLLTAVVPPGATTGLVTIDEAGGSATAGPFSVIPPPAITGFTPASGPVGTLVTLTGTGFSDLLDVSFNGTSAVTASLVGDTGINVVVPIGATTGPIRVTTTAGAVTSAASFTVTLPIPAPTLASFSPTSGGVGTAVTLLGTDFTGATHVLLNGAAVPFTVVSPTTILAAVPAGATSGSFTVTNPGGTTVSRTTFTLLSKNAVMAVFAFSPTRGPAGTVVTMTGPNVGTAGSVQIGGLAAPFVVRGPGELAVTIPAGAVTGTITVTTPGGSSTNPKAFTVTP